MTPEISTVIEPLTLTKTVTGLGWWSGLILVAWFGLHMLMPGKKSRIADWVWLCLSLLLFFIMVDIPKGFSNLVFGVFTIAAVWSFHTVPINFILGFHYRRRFSKFADQRARVQGYGQIRNTGWLGLVTQQQDLSEQALNYSEILKKGLQISGNKAPSEWALVLSKPLTPTELRDFEALVSQMAWFAISPAPTIWPQADHSHTLIVRATLLRSQDHARVIQAFYRTLASLSEQSHL